MARINFDCLEPLRVRQWVIEDIGIRDEPCVAVTEILFGFAGQTAIGCPTAAQLTLFPRWSRPIWITAWEQRKLGELTSIKTGDSDLRDAAPDGRYPFFVRSDKVERSNRYLYDGEAILVPGEGRLGEIFHYVNGKFDYHQRVYKISDFNGVTAKFVMYSMMRDFKKHALQNTAKATVDSIRLPTLTEFQFSLPKPEEQKKIGQYFSQIDSLITLHQRA